MYPWLISCAKGKLVWVESQSDPRWENRNYSVIKLMDLHNHKTIKLSRKSRYLSASLSPDGRQIAAVENTSGNINSIVFIDAGTGTVLQSVPAPENAFFSGLNGQKTGKKLLLFLLTEAGEGIMSYTLQTRDGRTSY